LSYFEKGFGFFQRNSYLKNTVTMHP
jgi:hypothetical protein